MTDLKEDFKKWLVDTKKVKNNTANTYISHIVSAYKKNFDSSDWKSLSENIIPLLVKYCELAHKEYFIDRITIWHALDYFAEVIGFINSTKLLKEDTNQTVKLYLYCYEGDFYIDSVNLENLLDYMKIFTSFCYSQGSNQNNLKPRKANTFLSKIEKIIAANNLSASSIYDSALHIIYEEKSVRLQKTALSLYCTFLYDTFHNPQYDYQNNTMVCYISLENPKSKIGGNYEIDQNLTGSQPLQIRIKDTSRTYEYEYEEVPDYILIVPDFVHIFNLDKKTVRKYFQETSTIDKIKAREITNINSSSTFLRTYFSIKDTNRYLAEHYHSIHKRTKSSDNAKNLNAYDDWLNRTEATDLLEISHNNFHTRVKPSNCSYLNYIDNPQYPAEDKKQYKYRRYYKPDLLNLKSSRLVKCAQSKKLKYKAKN